MVRTFLDAGALIAGARSVGHDRERALQLLEEPNRVFLTSPFVHLEVVPKAIFVTWRRLHLHDESRGGASLLRHNALQVFIAGERDLCQTPVPKISQRVRDFGSIGKFGLHLSLPLWSEPYLPSVT